MDSPQIPKGVSIRHWRDGRDRDTFLHVSARRGDADSLRLGLRSGCHVNARNARNMTPLLCADFRKPSIVRLLLNAGADGNARSGDRGPLHYAIAARSVESARLLLRAGADARAMSSAMLHAVRSGSPEIVRLLHEHRANLSFEHLGTNLVMEAAMAKNEPMVRLLLSLDAIPVRFADHRGKTPLHYVVRLSDAELTRWAIRRGAAVEARDNVGATVAHDCARYGNLDQLKLLVECDASTKRLTWHGETLLHMAAANSTATNCEMVKLLLDRGASLHAKTSDDRTPLHYALLQSTNTAEIVGLMLERGASFDDTGRATSPFMTALLHREPDVVRAFVDHGADLGRVNFKGKTALHAAAMGRCLETIDYLVDEGLDVDAKDDEGLTPLHQAVKSVNVRACRHLLRRGARPDAKSNSGATPLGLAMEEPRNEMLLETLLDHGAQISEKSRDGVAIFKVGVLGRNKNNYTYVLVKHLAKLVARGEKVDRECLNFVNGNECLRQCYEKCTAEFEGMKAIEIYNGISLFDMYMASASTLSGYARNKDFAEAFAGSCILREGHWTMNYGDFHKMSTRERISVNASTLYDKFNLLIVRHEQIVVVSEFLNEVFKLNDPLHIVNQRIIDFLNDQDLRKLYNHLVTSV